MATRDVPTSDWLPLVPQPAGAVVPNGDFATDISEWTTAAAAGTFVTAVGAPGTGAGQFADVRGLEVDSQGRVLAADDDNERWQRFSAGLAHELSIGGSGSGNGQFAPDDGPFDLAVTSGDQVWVVDRGNHRIQRFSATGGYAQTVPATGWALVGSVTGANSVPFATPQQLAVNPTSGDVYLCDQGNARVVRLDSAGVYLGQAPTLTSTYGLCIDSLGNVFTTFVSGGTWWMAKYSAALAQLGVSNFGNVGLLALATNSTNILATYEVPATSAVYICTMAMAVSASVPVAGTAAGAATTQYNHPYAIAYNPVTARYYVADVGNNRVKEISTAGAYLAHFAIAAGAHGIAVNAAGELWVAETALNQVRRYSTAGAVLETIPVASARSVAVGPGDVLWVTSGNTLLKYDEVGASAQDGRFSSPWSIDIRRATGRIYVLDSGNNRVQYFTAAGDYEGQWAVPTGARQLAVSQPSGDVYVVDPTADRVRRYGATGAVIADIGSSGTGDGQFSDPYAVAVHPLSGDVFVTDISRDLVQVFTAGGGFRYAFGAPGTADGQFTQPQGIAIAQNGTAAFVSDAGQERIQQFSLVGGAAPVWSASTPVGVGLGALALPVTAAPAGSAGQVINSGLFAINGRESVVVTAAVRTNHVNMMPRLQLLFYDPDGVLISTATEPDWAPVANDRPVRSFAARVPRTAAWYRVAFQPRVTLAGITGTAYLDDVRTNSAQLIVTEPVIGQLRVDARVPGRWV